MLWKSIHALQSSPPQIMAHLQILYYSTRTVSSSGKLLGSGGFQGEEGDWPSEADQART